MNYRKYGHDKKRNRQFLLLGLASSLAVHFFMLSLAMACWGPRKDIACDNALDKPKQDLVLELENMHKLRREIARESNKNKEPRVPRLAARSALQDGSNAPGRDRLSLDDPKLEARLRGYKKGVMRVWRKAAPAAPGFAVVVFKTGGNGCLTDYYVRQMSGGTDFRLFLREFMRELMGIRLVDSALGSSDWFECEFRVRANLAEEDRDE
ncbi:MAG: hypothetical protein R6V39_02020 [Desulfovibrionales bacterium]